MHSSHMGSALKKLNPSAVSMHVRKLCTNLKTDKDNTPVSIKHIYVTYVKLSSADKDTVVHIHLKVWFDEEIGASEIQMPRHYKKDS